MIINNTIINSSLGIVISESNNGVILSNIIKNQHGGIRISKSASNIVENNIRFHSMTKAHDISDRILCFLQHHNIPHIIADRGDAKRIIDNLFYINQVDKE